MKKKTLIFIALPIIFIIILIALIMLNKNEIKDNAEIEKIVADSNLELLLNLENFERESYSTEKLLEVSMDFASQKNYMNETQDGELYEYVNKNELHNIIYALTGITVEAPIQIENSLYVYDSENERYFLVPIEFAKYEITNINHIYKNDNTYTIECTAQKKQDGEIVDQKTFTSIFEKTSDNQYANYQLQSQTVSQK